MFVLVLAAEADETRQAITFLIVCLVGIAVLLAALTVWYWMFTSPKRRAERLLGDLDHLEADAPDADARDADAVSNDAVSNDADLLDPATSEQVLVGTAILSESSELMSSMLSGSEPDLAVSKPPTSPPSLRLLEDPPASAESEPRRIEVAERPSTPAAAKTQRRRLPSDLPFLGCRRQPLAQLPTLVPLR